MTTSLISLISIPEYRRLILSHIWFKDMRELVLTCKDAKHYVGNDVELLKHLLTIMSFHAYGISLSESFLYFPKEIDAQLDYHNLLRMASRVSAWPLKAVVGLPAKESRRRARYAMQEVNVDGRSCILFHGDRGRDRAFFSDDHFPVTGQFGNLSRGDEDVLGSSLLPFTKPYIFPQSPSSSLSQKSCKCKHSLVLSCISYYEISVLSPMPPDRLPQRPPPNLEPFLPPPCVCIGMARPGFSAFSMQPGWDSNSFAWHCDDGQLYFGDGSDSIPLLQSVDAHYGPGDTVGIGLVHGLFNGSLFFTKNGRLVGCFIPTESEARELVRYPWFAAVGVDCYCPVACNFGGGHDATPFQFDVHTFENDLKSHADSTEAKLDALIEKYQLLSVQRHSLAKTAALVSEVWQAVRDTPSAVSVSVSQQPSSVSQQVSSVSPVSRLMSARQQKPAQSAKRILPWFYDLQRPWRHKQLRSVSQPQRDTHATPPLSLAHPSVDESAVSRFFDERMTKIVKDVVQLQGWLEAAVAFEDLPTTTTTTTDAFQRQLLMRFGQNRQEAHLSSLFPFLLPTRDEDDDDDDDDEDDLGGDEEDDSNSDSDSDSDDNDNDSNGDIYEPIMSPAYVSSNEPGHIDPGHSTGHLYVNRRDTDRMVATRLRHLRHRIINALLPTALLSVEDTDDTGDTQDTDEDFEEMDEDDSSEDVVHYLRGGAREVEAETQQDADDDTESGDDTGTMDVEQRVFHDELMRILMKRVAGEEEAFQEIDDQDLDTMYHLQLQRQRQRQDEEENHPRLRRLYALDSSDSDSDSDAELDDEEEEEEEEEQRGSGDEVENQTNDSVLRNNNNNNNNNNGYEQWMRRMLQRLERQIRGGAEQGRGTSTDEQENETETESETTSSLLRRLRLLPPETILRFLLSQRSDIHSPIDDTTANATEAEDTVSRPLHHRNTVEQDTDNTGDKYVTCHLSLDPVVAFQPATKDNNNSSSSDLVSPPVSAFRSTLTSPVAPLRRDTHDTSNKVGYEKWSDEHLISTALRTSSLRELAQLQQASFLDAIATARHIDVSEDGTHEGEDEEVVVRSPKRSRYDH